MQVLAQVLGAGLGWVLAPTVSGVDMADRDAPRWKGLVIDGLSYLLFVCSSRLGIPCVSYMRHLTGLRLMSSARR